MVDEVETVDAGGHEETVVVEKRPLWQRILKWILIAVLALIVLVVVVVLGLNTSPGRRFLADEIGGYTTASGLNVQVGRIDGSLYGAMQLKDVRVRDPKGVFLTSPELDLDWRPFEFIHKYVDVHSVSSRLITMSRLPQFKPTPEEKPSNGPILPNIDIDVNRLAVDRLVLDAPVSGAKRILKVGGTVHIADRRAQVAANVDALTAPGVAGGDHLAVKLDAVPDDDKLGIAVDARSPANGIIASLSKVTKPLAFTISGRGSWKAWQGRALGTLGGQSLVDLGLAAHNGTFSVRGNAHPGLYMAGPVQRLTAPQLDISADVALDKRRADTRFALRSSALGVDGSGLVDLGNSRFGNFRLNAQLLTPGAIAPNLSGRDVAANLVLDGPFATPTVDYALKAASIGFGNIRVANVAASGLAKINSGHILVPLHATAGAITGLNAYVGGLAQNVAINGDIAIDGTQILSDNLHIQSSKIDATAIIAVDLAKGRYAGALKGRVNNYRIDSVGIVSVTTDAKLVPAANGGWGITGRIVARTSQIFNSGARNFLGGNAIVSTNVGYDTNGNITFNNLRLVAPQFRITNGAGRYDPAGHILVNADAYSTKYGPLTVRVTGTASSPVVDLRAAHPGFGIGLANLQAHVRGVNGAYAVTASGATNYGPFSANVVVRTGKQLAVDINSLLFAGINFHGHIVQTPAGPFAGLLSFAGSGLNGQVRLSSQNGVQRADVSATAAGAKLPGPVAITIGRAIVNASIVLNPGAPSIVADAQVADARYGVMTIAAARAKVNYVGGNGTAQLVASGSTGVPFQIAVNARLHPNDYLVALKGIADGVNFATGNPAHIIGGSGGYVLAPTQVNFDKGSLRIEGRFGKAMQVQARLDRLDLSILDAFVPNLGIGGSATGSLSYNSTGGSAIPTADVRMNIANFTRSSIAAVSQPVNVVFQGRLNASGGDARALIQTGTTTVGRIVASLSPLPATGGSWTTRLMAAPLHGGIRYNGPAATLFSLAALSGQQLTGPIAVAADFGGRLNAPQLNGLIRADNLTYVNETYGTRLTNLALDARFNNDRLVLNSLSAKAGDGTVKAQGYVGLAAAAGFPVDITATLDNARLANSDDLSATTSGTLHIVKNASGGAITGKLTIPNARYVIVSHGGEKVPELTGVHFKTKPGATPPAAPPAPAGLFKLDISIDADNQIFVSGMGLTSEWSLSMHVTGTSANPVVTGQVKIVRGTFSFNGKRFTIDRGTISFEGGPLSDPTLDISMSTTVNDITAVINVTGSGQHPQIAFTSDPVLPQDEVLSRLLFGTSPANLSALQALQLASALNGLRPGSGGGLNPLGKLRSATGLDRLEILGADSTTGRGTALAAGKYLTNNIYVSIITDARGYTATELEVALTKALSVISQAGSFGGSSVSAQYKKDY